MADDLLVKCVNAHDLCFGGTSAPCPYCEPVTPLRDARTGRFARRPVFCRHCDDQEGGCSECDDEAHLERLSDFRRGA